MSDDKVALQLDSVGFSLERSSRMTSSLRSLAYDFQQHLAFITQGPQAILATNFTKIMQLVPVLKQTIEIHDPKFDQSKKCAPVLNGIIQAFQEIQPYVPQISAPSANPIGQYQDQLTQKVGSIIQDIDKIMDMINACETQYGQTLKKIPENEQQVSYQIASCLAALDQLYIELIFLCTNKNVCASSTHLNQLQVWAPQIAAMSQLLLQTKRDNVNTLFTELPKVTSQFPTLATLIGTIQPLASDSEDFAKVSIALTNSMQTLNYVQSKILVRQITGILKEFVDDYLNGKDLKNMVDAAKTILCITREIIAPLGPNVICGYSTLGNLIETCGSDKELTALTLAGVLRYALIVLPDSLLAEDLLINLSKKIAIITKSIFKETQKIMAQVISVIDSNLEYFSDNALNEVNFYLSAIKNIEDFDPESNEFILVQQRFFDALGALPTPLEKIITYCSEMETKSQIQNLYDQIVSLGSKFAKWLNQFYLAIFSATQLRAQAILDVFSFPVTLLSSLGNQTSLQNIILSVSGIQTVLQSTPRVLLCNCDDILTLVKNMIELTKSGNEYVRIVAMNTSLPISPILKQSSELVSKLLNNIPNYELSVQSLRNFTTQELFVTGIMGCISKSLQLLKDSQSNISNIDAKTCYYLSVPFTFTLITNTIIKSQAEAGAIFEATMSTLGNAINIVYPIAIAVACGQQPPELAHFPTYCASIIKSEEELLALIATLPQPSLQYEIPDDVQEIKKFDSMAGSLHSSALKQFAQFIIRSLKKSTNPDVRNIMTQWFDATQVTTLDLQQAANNFKKFVTQLLTAATSDRSLFVESFAGLSVSLAYNENSFGKTVSPIIGQLHRQLVELVRDMLETGRNSSTQLMNIYGYISQILALLPISKLKQKEKNDYLTKILENIIISLNVIRTKGSTVQLSESLNAIAALKELQAFYQVSPSQDDIDVANIIELIISNRATKEILDSSTSKISNELLRLIPNQFQTLDRLRDVDTVCDFIYDKADSFRDDINKILQLAKNHNKDDKLIAEPLKSILLCASDSAVLTMHSLMLGGLAFTPLSATFVDCFSELFIALKEFTDIAFQISKKPKEDLSSELRKINRKMSKQLDSFINIVENPQQQTTEFTEFEATKNQMYADLSTVVVQLARLNALSSTSLVPEMYNDNRLEIAEFIQDSVSQLDASISNVRSKAVGASSTEIGNLMNQLQVKVNELVNVSEKMNFNDIFPPLPLYEPTNAVCEITHKMAILGPTLTDRIIIEPDPASAAKVPGDYTIPQLPKTTLEPNEALQDLTLSKRQVDEVLNNFKATIGASLATSGELLQAIDELRAISNTFTEKALVMAVATPDSRYQVEQQTALHAFANAINGIQSAMKSRLLRSPGFNNEMEESITFYITTLEKCMELAEIASKIEVAADNNDDEAMDEVTRELNATANAIEAMSAKLKEFENQVNMDDVEIEEDEQNQRNLGDLQAAAGSLPAFLIACAGPIFAASSAVVKRAQEITAKLLQTYGKIDNERGLIRAAQDLSEAAELILICAEILVGGTEKDAEFKVIAASRIIKASIAALVSQVLAKGGDSEGIMSRNVKEVSKYADSVIKRAEQIVDEKLNEEEAKKPQKKVNNPMIMKLNMQQVVNNNRKQLQEEEKNLYQFRRK